MAGSTHHRRMTLGEHLEDLRGTAVRSLLGLVVAACVTLPFGRQIIVWVCRPLTDAQESAGITPGAYVFSPLTGFAVYLKVSLIAAFVLALPWVLHQVWRFLSVGLYESERRILRLLTPLSAGLTLMAVAFLYYVMLPVTLWFLITFALSYPPPGVGSGLVGDAGSGGGAQGLAVTVPMLDRDPVDPGDGQLWYDTRQNVLKVYVGGGARSFRSTDPSLAQPLIDLNKYLSFACVLALGVLVAFQLPTVMLVLGRVGVLTHAVTRRFRKHALFACFAAGALLTPADVLSMFVLAGPLYLLFELGLLLMRGSPRRSAGQGATG